MSPLFGRSWFFGMVERRYSRRHQDNSTRSDRLARSRARSLSGLNNGTMEEGSFSLAPSFEGTTHARRRCYKVCRCSFCRHENGELLTQWRPLNRAARARPKVKVDGALERGLEGVSEGGCRGRWPVRQLGRSFVIAGRSTILLTCNRLCSLSLSVFSPALPFGS